jgi:flagellar hook-length control protein FliK
MIPFSGLFQAVDGAAFSPGANRTEAGAGMANRIHGHQETRPAKNAAVFLDDADGSFVEWVKKLMDTEAPASVDGELVTGFLDSGHGSASVVPFPLEQKELRTPPEEGEGHGPSALPMGELTALVSQTGDAQPIAPKGGLTNPITQAGDEQLSAPKGGLTDPIAQDGDGKPTDSHVRPAVSAFQSTAAPETRPPASGLTPSPAEGQDRQPQAIGIPTSSGHDGDIRGDAGPRGFSMEVKPTDPASSKPVIASGDEGSSTSSPALDSRLPSGLASAGKGPAPASVTQPSVAALTKEPESVNAQAIAPADVNKKAAPTGQLPESVKTADPEPARSPAVFQDPETAVDSKTAADMASQESDTADSRGNDRQGRSQRIAMAEVKDSESQKDQPLDSSKNTPVESIRSQAGFQETAKAVAVEPSTTAADKSAAAQSAASARTDPSAEKTFQATVMDQIVDKAAMRSNNGRSEIQIQLKPEFLGKVQMNIVAEKDQLAVRIVADQSVVKDIIETHIHHLKTELQNQGLAVEKIEVLVNPDGDPHPGREQPSQTFKHHASPNGGRQQYADRDPEKRERSNYSHDNDPDSDGDGINYFA